MHRAGTFQQPAPHASSRTLLLLNRTVQPAGAPGGKVNRVSSGAAL
jgi:hypothetical protein